MWPSSFRKRSRHTTPRRLKATCVSKNTWLATWMRRASRVTPRRASHPDRDVAQLVSETVAAYHAPAAESDVRLEEHVAGNLDATRVSGDPETRVASRSGCGPARFGNGRGIPRPGG